jgi:Na+-transporting methylmalonyl-CoA/oxaloacetate decarboxylase gamma subunit
VWRLLLLGMVVSFLVLSLLCAQVRMFLMGVFQCESTKHRMKNKTQTHILA